MRGYLPLVVVAALVLVISTFGGSSHAYAGTTFAVTKTQDIADGSCDSDCSLREAVIAANASLGHDSISVPAGIYTLGISGASENGSATGDLDITDDADIIGAGVGLTTIDAARIDR